MKKEEWHIIKVKDKLTKNHWDLENIVSGVMPENKTDELCPVKSFKKYIEHLNPNYNFMWQYPLKKINQTTQMSGIQEEIFGKTLATFMSEVSKNCKLSRIYMNHSIRVTGCTVLTRCQFSSSEIMSVSGHKGIQSLTIYQKTHEIKSMKWAKHYLIP